MLKLSTQLKLTEVTNDGLSLFNDNAEFLWIFGYMISLFPYYFGEYQEWEKKGKEMIEQAHRLKQDDPLIAMLYLNDESNKEYQEACLSVKKVLSDRIQGNGAISQYFRGVLDR